MAKILIIAEHDGSALNPATAKCVSCAAAIDGAEIDVLVLAAAAGDIAAQAGALDGVSRVLTAERPENEHAVAAVQAPPCDRIANNDLVAAPGVVGAVAVRRQRAPEIRSGEQGDTVLHMHLPQPAIEGGDSIVDLLQLRSVTVEQEIVVIETPETDEEHLAIGRQ